MVGRPTTTTEFSAYNNGGNVAFACLYEGPPTTACPTTAVNDGSNHYTVTIPLPDDTATATAFGTAMVATRRADQGAHAATDWSAAGSGRLSRRLCGSTSSCSTRPYELALSGSVAAAPRDRVGRKMQRLPRGAGDDLRLEHDGQRLPRRRAQHLAVLHRLPRREPRFGDRHDRRLAAERGVPVRPHDPRHPRQFDARSIRSRTAIWWWARSATRPTRARKRRQPATPR